MILELKPLEVIMVPNLLIKISQFFFKQKGNLYQTSCVYTPEQNDVFERKNRYL
jgi:hypothetical protein